MKLVEVEDFHRKLTSLLNDDDGRGMFSWNMMLYELCTEFCKNWTKTGENSKVSEDSKASS